ncbi:MAG: CaiB/BaiF CoA-transferase family protein [Steroidobacteraceae bacterium]
MSGPLTGFKVIELAGIGPGPFCAMMLADMGADVVRIERGGSPTDASRDPLQRNRRSVALNLKHPDGLAAVLKLVEKADALIEGYRPGVAERLGLGPEVCLQRNSKLVYGRMTGWGQDGPLAKAAGHDINYIALTGALHLIGPAGGKPTPPLNLIGDFGGGGMLLGFGVLAAMLEATRSGKGQVVDAAMVDGTVALMGMMFALRAGGFFRDATGENLFAGGVPIYDTYQTKDGKYVSIGSLEPQFYAILVQKLGLDDEQFRGLGVESIEDPAAQARWPALRAKLTEVFKTRTRDEWNALFEGTDACYAPVLSFDEAAQHPHNVARRTYVEVGGVMQNAPAPRFSRTPAAMPQPGRKAGIDTEAVLRDAGFAPEQIAQMRAKGAIG